MSRAAVDPAVADVRRRLREIYAERFFNGRWETLGRLLVRWTPHLSPAPPPAKARRVRARQPNVIILYDRVRQRREAAIEAAREEEA
jgi:hypothetical protein